MNYSDFIPRYVRLTEEVRRGILHVAEYKRSADSAREMTAAADRRLVDAVAFSAETTAIAWASTAITKVSMDKTPRLLGHPEIAALTAREKDALFKCARSGFRIAVTLSHSEATVLFQRHGYVVEGADAFTTEVAAAWARHLPQLMTYGASAVLFGHDLEPVLHLWNEGAA